MRLLIADDDPSLRLALRLVLEDAGHSVREVDTVAQALAALASESIDLAVVDAGLSGRGVDLWRSIVRERGPARALLVTGDPVALGSLASHDSVLGKPFDFRDLLERIAQAGAA